MDGEKWLLGYIRSLLDEAKKEIAKEKKESGVVKNVSK